MTGRHDVPGGWVVICAPEEVFEGHRRPIRLAQAKMSANPEMRELREEIRALAGSDDPKVLEQFAADHEAEYGERMAGQLPEIMEIQELTVIARVRAWSFTGPDGQALPISKEGIFFLPGAAYDAIGQLVKDEALTPDMDVSPDPKAVSSSSTG